MNKAFLEYYGFADETILLGKTDEDMGWHLDGIEATKTIRSLERADAKSVPIIAMSADAFEESIQSAKEAGMNGYITKPVIPEKMFEELSRHLS